MPAVNVVSTNSVNAVLEAAKVVNSPVIIQFSNGGAAFYAGKGLSNENERAAIAGAISVQSTYTICLSCTVFL
jgi:fructose-bisphosphate aldolase, class II